MSPVLPNATHWLPAAKVFDMKRGRETLRYQPWGGEREMLASFPKDRRGWDGEGMSVEPLEAGGGCGDIRRLSHFLLIIF